MRRLTLPQIEMFPWYAFAAYWAITWLQVKRTKERENAVNRLITIGVLLLAFALLLTGWLRVGPLRLRFVPETAWTGWTGIVLTCVGVAVAIWARYSLGQNWSARITLKEGHELIRSGPYAWVRHPIYAGILLAVAGAALVAGELRAILALVLILTVHSFKALSEERMLAQEFGDEYARYRRNTGFLFPRLRISPP